MGTDVDALKSAFATNTNLAEWAAFAVFIGLLIDISVIFLFDLFDRDKSRWEIALAFIGTAVIAAGVWGESHFGHLSTRASSRIQAVLEQQTAAANAKAEQFRLAIAQAEIDAQSAQLEQQKLKHENLNLAKALQPRRVGTTEWNGVVLTGGLDRFVGTPVLIQSVPDWESTRLASDLAGVVSKFGWKPSFADAFTTTVAPLAISDGVQIFTVRDRFVLNRRPPYPGTEAQKRAALAAQTLSKYLQIFNVQNEHRGLRRPWEKNDASPKPFAPGFSTSDDTVIVLVGRNADWETEYLVLSNENPGADIAQLLELKDKGPFPFGWGWQ